jgi:hypothetical protein
MVLFNTIYPQATKQYEEGRLQNLIQPGIEDFKKEKRFFQLKNVP